MTTDRRAGDDLCGKDLWVEQVVTTTYLIRCPIHGVVGGQLSLAEASSFACCPMPHEATNG